MTQRLVLAFGSLLLLAALGGCSAAGSLSMTPVEDSESLGANASHEIGGNSNTYEMHRQQPIEAAIENDAVTVNGTHLTTGSDLPYEHRGRYYDVTGAIIGQTAGYHGEAGIDYNSSTVEGTVVAYRDLPAVDRRALAPLLAPPREGDEPGSDIDIPVSYTEAQANASMLVTEQAVDGIRYEGETYDIHVTTEAATLDTYRYNATLVAASSDEYAALLDRRYAFTLTNLSDEETEILDRSIGDTHYIENEGNSGFASLVDRFRHHRPVRVSEYDGAWLVRYDGRRYWAEVDFGMYVSGDEPIVLANSTASS
jgi:hypothetical protein